jgi:hypothetical protein
VLVLPLFVAAVSPLLPPSIDELLDRADRPIPTYIQVTPPETSIPTRMYAEADPFVLYINRWGGSYACNDDDASRNFSSIACETASGVANVGPFSGTDSQWGTVMSCLEDLFSPFRLAVTDIEPVGLSYIEAVVGGRPGQVGMSGGVGGVAPYSCRVINGAVVYAFSDIYGNDMRSVCETTAQEIAHAFGLDHEFLCQDPLTYLDGCGAKSFQDQWAPCGEFEPRACTCGSTTQNSVQAMLGMFGAADGSVWEPPLDLAPPTVSLIEPNDLEILPADQDVLVMATASDDVGLTVVQLEWGITGDVFFCPITTNKYRCTKQGDTFVWQIRETAGARPFRVRVRDVAGNEVVTEDRAVWLSRDGKGPPPDKGPPAIVLGAPLTGERLPPSTFFDVVATVVDDNALALVEMNWPRRGQDFWIPCPYEDERLSCTVEGKTYRWNVSTGRRQGERVFQIRAIDMLGKTATTDPIALRVEEGAELPETNGSETFDSARTVGCDVTFDMASGSADWFSVDARPGEIVRVSVSGDDPALLATNGQVVLAEGVNNELEVVQATEGPLVRVGIQPSTAESTVRVSVTCEAPAAPAPKTGCATAGFPSALGVFLLALWRRRRA